MTAVDDALAAPVRIDTVVTTRIGKRLTVVARCGRCDKRWSVQWTRSDAAADAAARWALENLGAAGWVDDAGMLLCRCCAYRKRSMRACVCDG